jgi:hypothetical protein
MIHIMDPLSEIEATYSKNMGKIRKLLEMDHKEEAVILTVTVFEVFFRDLFRVTREIWFFQYSGALVDSLPISERIKAKKKIRDYLKSLRAYEEFLGNYYVYESASITATKDSIFFTLFDENEKMSYLNFQQLTGERGVKEAYKVFFDIDVIKLMDGDENQSYLKWERLNKLFKDRHEIVHKGKNTEFSKEEITNLLNSIDFLKSNVVQKILSPYAGSIE